MGDAGRGGAGETGEVGVGIIGAGRMGRVHASNLAKGILTSKLVAVF